MGTCVLPGMHTLSPQACSPRASGVYINQTTRAHSITIKSLTGLETILPLCLLLSFLPTRITCKNNAWAADILTSLDVFFLSISLDLKNPASTHNYKDLEILILII